MLVVFGSEGDHRALVVVLVNVKQVSVEVKYELCASQW